MILLNNLLRHNSPQALAKQIQTYRYKMYTFIILKFGALITSLICHTIKENLYELQMSPSAYTIPTAQT